MKRIAMFVIGCAMISLYGEVDYSYVKDQSFYIFCSSCGKRISDVDLLVDSGKTTGLVLCRFCLKRMMQEEEKKGAIVSKASSARLGSGGSEDEGAVWKFEGRAAGTSLLARAGRRGHVVMLRGERTGEERKNKSLFWRLVKEEAQIALEHTWVYKVLDDYRGVEVKNQKLPGGKLEWRVRSLLKKIWYQGPRVIFFSDDGYEVYDFSSKRSASFREEQSDDLNEYLDRNGYLDAEFKEYSWGEESLNPAGEVLERPAVFAKKILKSEEKVKEIQRKRQERLQRYDELERKRQDAQKLLDRSKKELRFTDEASAEKPLVKQKNKPLFYYTLTNGRTTLMVGNEEGYVLECPLGEKIIGVATRGTEAVISTESGKQFLYDFERHAEEGPVYEKDHPIAILESPVRSDAMLIKQGFSPQPTLKEKSLDEFFHELAVIPEGYTSILHPAYALQELMGHLAVTDSREETTQDPNDTELAAFIRKQKVIGKKTTYEFALSEDKTAVDLSILTLNRRDEIEDEDEYGISLSGGQAWSRGAELLLPDNGDFLRYDFKAAHVDRFQLKEVPSIQHIENMLPGLGFCKVQ